MKSERSYFISYQPTKIRSTRSAQSFGATGRRRKQRIPRTPSIISRRFLRKELSQDKLLNRCLGGHTQNSNESFNATVWNLAPKSYSSGKKILNIAIDIAVCNFNDDLTNILWIIKVFEMNIGIQSYNFCLKADAKWIKHAEPSLIDAAKEARSSIKSSRKENEEEYLNLEGQLYGPGIADWW